MITKLIAVAALATSSISGCGAQQVTVPPAVSTPMTALSRPDPAITPGAVLNATAQQVCTAGWASAHRRGLTAKQKAAVLRAYRLPADTKVAEWDHLIPLELGGGNGVRQIWPQLSKADMRRKDALEDRLHVQVCGGVLTLKVAQDRAREFWLWW